MRNQILKHEEDKDLSFSLVLIEEYFYANLILAGLDFAMQLFAASSQPLKSKISLDQSQNHQSHQVGLEL